MNSKTATPPKVERRKPQPRIPPKDYGWTLYLIIITLLMVAGFFISTDRLYTPGDNIGYNLGLSGGLMMLSLLIYSLRKRIGIMNNWGLLPHWFKWHMVFGVLGPALIMFHSTFTIGSVNAGVAMISMLLVSGSGIFGRFFYTKIHHGLYGRQTTLQQLQDELGGSGDVKSIFSFAPNIQKQLVEFRDLAVATSQVKQPGWWIFIKVGFRANVLSRTLIRELEDVMYANAMEKQWNDIQMKRLDEMFYQNEKFIRSYIMTIRDLAQFSTYEKLFSLWHLFHVPMVYMLVFSAIWHVIAVHQY